MDFFMGNYGKKLRALTHHYMFVLPGNFPAVDSLVAGIETEEGIGYLFLEPSGSGNAIYKNGRVLLPKAMVDDSGIGTDVVVLGCYNRIELWNRERWEKYDKKAWEQYVAELDTL